MYNIRTTCAGKLNQIRIICALPDKQAKSIMVMQSHTQLIPGHPQGKIALKPPVYQGSATLPTGLTG